MEPEAKKLRTAPADKPALPPLDKQRLRDVLQRELANEDSGLTRLVTSFYEDLRDDQDAELADAPSEKQLEDEGVRALFVLMVWRFLEKGRDYKTYRALRSSLREDLSEHKTAALSADKWVTNFPYHIHIDVESDDHLDALRVGCETFFGSDDGTIRRLYEKLTSGSRDLFFLP
jgi:hypothetical protein